YFDLFHYPLTSNEIRSFLDQPVFENEFTNALDQLVSAKKIFLINIFYSLHNDPALVERRIQGNQRAAVLIVKAEKIANLLYKFPYIRGVGVSGSVSKNFADEDADIDYFIITKANRLWIARTLLHLYKKNPFLKDRKHHYCMNYFVDEAELTIEEKNIYTATELHTVIPLAGNGSINGFFETNAWSHNYFPNRALPLVKGDLKKDGSWFKTLAESILNNKLGDWLDNYFLKLTARRWKKKEDEQQLNTKGERMGLKTSKHCSKPNPVFFHDWFMNKYEKNLDEWTKKWEN
ncbi:MAG TPA: hypothetical protein VFH08_05665, partial [Chitinophagaceae bacterium]|nr:hypothetical protein [Chitinophagaceae bacterium]